MGANTSDDKIVHADIQNGILRKEIIANARHETAYQEDAHQLIMQGEDMGSEVNTPMPKKPKSDAAILMEVNLNAKLERSYQNYARKLIMDDEDVNVNEIEKRFQELLLKQKQDALRQEALRQDALQQSIQQNRIGRQQEVLRREALWREARRQDAVRREAQQQRIQPQEWATRRQEWASCRVVSLRQERAKRRQEVRLRDDQRRKPLKQSLQM